MLLHGPHRRYYELRCDCGAFISCRFLCRSFFRLQTGDNQMIVIVRKTKEEKYIVEVNDDVTDVVSEALAHIRIYAKEPDQVQEYSRFEFERIR